MDSWSGMHLSYAVLLCDLAFVLIFSIFSYVQSIDPVDKDAWKDKGTGHLSIKCQEGVSKGTKESKPTIIVRNDVCNLPDNFRFHLLGQYDIMVDCYFFYNYNAFGIWLHDSTFLLVPFFSPQVGFI